VKLIRVDSIYRAIPLDKGYVTIVDAADYDLVASFAWRVDDGPTTVYATRPALAHEVRAGEPKRIRLHRVLVPGFQAVDHRNGWGLDNRRCNLRGTSQSLNAGNARLSRRNSSGFKGVSHTPGGRWRAYIRENYKLRAIGRFSTKEEAARAYDEAARAAFGEFAALNFPRPGERSALVPE
jgi:hypothetical protein